LLSAISPSLEKPKKSGSGERLAENLVGQENLVFEQEIFRSKILNRHRLSGPHLDWRGSPKVEQLLAVNSAGETEQKYTEQENAVH
jgi:hypothetical protein